MITCDSSCYSIRFDKWIRSSFA